MIRRVLGRQHRGPLVGSRARPRPGVLGMDPGDPEAHCLKRREVVLGKQGEVGEGGELRATVDEGVPRCLLLQLLRQAAVAAAWPQPPEWRPHNGSGPESCPKRLQTKEKMFLLFTDTHRI